MALNFKYKENISIKILTGSDIRAKSNLFDIFKERILMNERMYPEISRWFKEKVVPGIISKERLAYICLKDNKPVATAIAKRGEFPKFCHLKIEEDVQDQNLGEMLFIMMTIGVGKGSKEIHFTLPESLWHARKGFFGSFGFKNFHDVGCKYRPSESEFLCSASFKTVWRSALKKLPKLIDHFCINGLSTDNPILMSLKPQHAKSIIQGRKTIEIRRRFSHKWLGQRVSIYASSPIRSLICEAQIKNISSASPEEIWEECGYRIGCTKQEYESYTDQSENVYAIEFEHIKPYDNLIKLDQINNMLESNLKPPQSYQRIKPGSDWSRILLLSALAQFDSASEGPDAEILELL